MKQTASLSVTKRRRNNTPNSKSNISKNDVRTKVVPPAKRKLEIGEKCSQSKVTKWINRSPKSPLKEKTGNHQEDEIEIEEEVISIVEESLKENVNLDQSEKRACKSSEGDIKRINLETCISVDKDVSMLSTPETSICASDKRPSSTINILTDTSDKSVILESDSDGSLRPLPKESGSQTSTSTENFETSKMTESQSELDDLFDDSFEQNWLAFDKTKIDFTTYQRCKVVGINYEANRTMLSLEQKMLSDSVSVCGSWVRCIVRIGDTVVIRAEKKGEEWTVDDVTGMLVVHPDTLLSGTSISTAAYCMRKSVLAEKFRKMDGLPTEDQDSTFLVVGILVHELLQMAITKNIYRISEIRELMEKILSKRDTIKLLYETNIKLRTCREKMSIYIPRIQEFILYYIKDQNQSEIASKKENFKGKITEIRDIEEIVWSPELGIKGKIDITAEVKINSKSKIMPIEVKTGKASFSSEHRGQVILYLMMMGLTEQDTDTGLLLYLKENHVREIKSQRPEERDLMILRNSLAHYLTLKRFDSSKELEKIELPEPVNSPWCSTCEYNTLCCAFLSRDDALQDTLSESHSLKQVADRILGKYKPEHIDYFLLWVWLLQLEESAYCSESTLKHLWTQTPEEREKKKRTVCNLKMLDTRESNGNYVTSFARASKSAEKIPHLEFDDNEYVTISTNTRINLAVGFITERSEDQISVTVDRDLIKYKHEIFHVNKYSSFSCISTNLANVGGLMTNNEICAKLREIVIDKKPATFNENSPLINQLDTIRLVRKLNKDQLAAIKKALSANDYLLIKGMPGTGKTETLVSLIIALKEMKLSVLVTAHTNSAVDNILLKLLERGVDFLRLGSSAHPSLINKTDARVTSNCTTPESLEEIYSSKDIVGTTCYGANHPLFKRRTFDFCLVDESTQALQSTVLRPLYSAKKFILLGDPDQLPPTVRNVRAKKLGADESLFSRLDNENNTINLTLQYRMNSRIMYVANKFTYKDMLKSGDVAIADGCISTQESVLSEENGWIRKALSPLISDSVILINTGRTCHVQKSSGIKEPFCNSDGTCSNYWEAAIASKLVQTLLMMGVSVESIGIISPYRAQVDLLGRVIRHAVEINTVDQYQGRDKDIIIYSCVKSLLETDAVNEENEILGDRRRLTVAITRAKKKLIIIADKLTMSRYSTFDDLYKIIDETDNGENVINLIDHMDLFTCQQLIDIS